MAMLKSSLDRGLRTAMLVAFAVGVSIPSAQAQQFYLMHDFRQWESEHPTGGVVIDGQGRLYGATSSELFTFVGKSIVFLGYTGEGYRPTGSLAVDAAGNVYGTNRKGGTYSQGNLFRYSPIDGFQTLAALPGSGAGGQPYGGLVIDADGSLYGTATRGGDTRLCTNYPPYGCGTVFRLRPGASEVEVLHTFTETDGKHPTATLVLSEGVLHGTTTGGGAADSPRGPGTIIRLATDGTAFSASPLTGASFPYAGLTQDAQGNRWGVAMYGGAHNCGAIYRIDDQGNDEVVHSFKFPEGTHPRTSLLLGSDGMLYGTANTGGGCYYTVGCGTVFRFNPTTRRLTVLHVFKRDDGDRPRGALAQDAEGNLYGTTERGGRDLKGVVFRISP
jgi:uncharacterized repeat protein (TIGR03803 family)